MVVVVAGQHVAGDSLHSQRRGHSGGETDGFEGRVHLQGQPGGDEGRLEAEALGVGHGHHGGQPFVLDDRRHRQPVGHGHVADHAPTTRASADREVLEQHREIRDGHGAIVH
jgi:hypothetical protein